MPEHAYLAVDFFFMLSGVVVAHAYEARLRDRLSFIGFVRIRLTRLYPLLALGVVFGTIELTARGLRLGDIGAKQIIGASVLALMILPVPRPNGASAFPVNGPMWSLFFELLANYLYALVFARLRTRPLIVVTAVLMACYAFSCVRLGTVNCGIGWNSTFPLGLLKAVVPFLYGVLLFRLNLLAPRPTFPMFPLAAVLLMATLFAPVPLGGRGLGFDLVSQAVVFPAIIVLGSAPPRHPGYQRLWSALGDLSYPVYVLHQPILHGVRQLGYPAGPGALPYLLWSVAVAVLSIAVAFAAFRYYDLPLRSLLRRRRLNRVAARASMGLGGGALERQ